MTIIWGLKVSGGRAGNPRQPGLSDLRIRAKILLEILESDAQMVLLPTVALSEILIRVPEAKHQEFLATAQKMFYCPSFDLPASAVAAKLWLANRNLPPEDQLKRATLKADVQIIATAAVHGATRFYSNDKKARKLAEIANMEAFDLPMRHPDMHVDAEIRREFANEDSATQS
jgi:predicted nucleic acid-binding protein